MGPNLAGLISSNQSPTSIEILLIESRLRSSDVVLAELDERILKVSLILREWESQRKCACTVRTSLQAVLSPLRRFPAEILAEIFLLCRNSTLASGGNSTLDPGQAPLVFGQICSRWRAVSQNTSRLWDQIHIQGAIPPMRDVSGHLETFATGARNRPLDLLINTRSYERIATSGRTRPLDLVLPLRHRLQSIHLTLNWNECQSSGLPVDNTFPILTSLFIDIHNSPQLAQPELFGLVDSFGTLPSLQSLTLHATKTLRNRLLSTVPWPQLTHLDLRVEMPVVAAQQILLQAQRLQTLGGIQFSAEVPTISPIRVLPEMRSIKFSARWENITVAFFQPFSFPNLKSLNLEAYEASQTVLLDIHAQSGFQLEDLELSDLELGTDGFISFLRLQPSLIHLSLHHCAYLDDHLFISFTYDSLSPTLPISFPLLQTLGLQQCADSLNGNIVVGMVESLSAPAEDRPAGHPFPKLSEIDLRLDGYFNSGVESRLATLSAPGFLLGFRVRCDPSKSDGSDSFSDWYVSLAHFGSTLIFFLVADLNLVHFFSNRHILLSLRTFSMLSSFPMLSHLPTNFSCELFRSSSTSAYLSHPITPGPPNY